MIKALLFDKDGTLFDFYASWGQATREAALLVANQDPSKAQYLLEQSGLDTATGRFVPGSLIASGSNDEIAHCWADLLERRADYPLIYEMIERHFRAAQLARAVPVIDLSVFFGELKTRGFGLGIATMDSEASARASMAQLQADQYLDFICGFDTGHGVKPGGGMVRAFADHLRLAPKEIAVIGDSPHDMEMAHDGGAGLVIGVLTGVSPKEVLMACHAHHVLDDISKLPALLLAHFIGAAESA